MRDGSAARNAGNEDTSWRSSGRLEHLVGERSRGCAPLSTGDGGMLRSTPWSMMSCNVKVARGGDDGEGEDDGDDDVVDEGLGEDPE